MNDKGKITRILNVNQMFQGYSLFISGDERVHPQKRSSVQILNFSLSFISIVAHHSFFEILLSGRLQYTEILITCRRMAFLCQSQYWPIIPLLLLLLMDGYKCTHM